MPFDDAADFAAGVCAGAINPPNDVSASPTKKALNKFMLAFVFRMSRRVQSHRSSTTRRHSRSDRPTLSAVLQLRCAERACAVDTTEDFVLGFHAVADDTAVAVRANRRQRVDCALETVEDVTLSVHDYFKRLVIFVFANFACRHTQFVRVSGGWWRCRIRRQKEIPSTAPTPPCSARTARVEILLVLNAAKRIVTLPNSRDGSGK